jgi:hypothetical protein
MSSNGKDDLFILVNPWIWKQQNVRSEIERTETPSHIHQDRSTSCAFNVLGGNYVNP